MINFTNLEIFTQIKKRDFRNFCGVLFSTPFPSFPFNTPSFLRKNRDKREKNRKKDREIVEKL